MSRFHKVSGLVALIALVALATSVAAFARSSASTISVTAGKPSEFHFTLSKKTAAKGVVVFSVKNGGKISHDFKIAGKVTKQLAAGKSAVLKVTFAKAGKYPFLCSVPGHAGAGMKGVLVVK